MIDIKPIVWTVQDQLDRVAQGEVGFIARLDVIDPAPDVPLYDKATVDMLMAALRHVVRVWIVDDDAYDPEAETERKIERLIERGANVRIEPDRVP